MSHTSASSPSSASSPGPSRRGPSRRGLSRRGLLAAGGAAGLGALLAACGSDGGSASDAEKGGAWSFTDDRGKKIGLDAKPQHIVAYVGTAAALHDFGVDDQIVGVFGPAKKKNGKPDVLAGDLDTGKLEIIGNAYGQFDIEKYAKVRPDLLITNMYLPGALWYVPDESKSKILKLAPSLALKSAQVSMRHTIERYSQLAKALGADQGAKKVVDAKARFDKAAGALRKAAESSGGIKVMAASGAADLFYVSDPEANADLRFFKELGVDFIVPDKVSKQGFYEELSWENADKYKADVIMLDNRTQSLQPDALKSKPSWRRLPAVKADQVTTWDAEPRFSYAGAAPLLENLAKTVEGARKTG